MVTLVPHFTTTRMVREYTEQYYLVKQPRARADLLPSVEQAGAGRTATQFGQRLPKQLRRVAPSGERIGQPDPIKADPQRHTQLPAA